MKTVTAISEKDLQNAAVALAKTLGYRVAHFRPAIGRGGRWSTPMQGHPGWPDLVLVGRGRVVFRELKVGTNNLSPDQEMWGAALLAAGADWAVWHDFDWPGSIQLELERLAA